MSRDIKGIGRDKVREAGESPLAPTNALGKEQTHVGRGLAPLRGAPQRLVAGTLAQITRWVHA